MNNKLFREKSIERVSSPEQLNDYIRVTNPGVWMILAGIILVLAGICVWGIFGRLESYVTVAAITEENRTICYVKETDIAQVSPNMPVRLGSSEYTIREISFHPVQVDESFPTYLCHVGDLSDGEWVYEVGLSGTVGEDGGIFQADIITESIPPLNFVTN